MKSTILSTMSVAQKSQLKKELLAEEEAQQRAKEANRETYKQLCSELVERFFPALQEASQNLAQLKAKIYDSVGQCLELKAEVFGHEVERQQSHTLINQDKTRRIRIGTHQLDSYDDTVSSGMEKVLAYLNSLVDSEKGRVLRESIETLIKHHGNARLEASRVLQLKKIALQTGDAGFIEGMQIIEKSHSLQPSKNFVLAEYKDEKGQWHNVPLGITESGNA